MSRFIETIRIANGGIENISLHQNRVDETYNHFGKKPLFNLSEIILPDNISTEKIIKCRIEYNLNGDFNISYTDYSIKEIKTFTIVQLTDQQYDFKYADRDWIIDLLNKAGSDEIIMVKDGLIRDASYANLVFFDGKKWLTPLNPLLMGTRRANLIKNNVIETAKIFESDLAEFKKIKFINAMMTWEESPTLDI